MLRFTTVLLAVMLMALVAYGITINVPGNYPTIQAGINASNDGDTVLVASGTYTGPDNKNLDFGGRAIVVMSENGPENCMIDCQSIGRGAYFHSGETSTSILQGFTIKGGSSSNGGGINITNSSPIIMYCIISFCENQSYGGAVYILNGDPEFINCDIVHNEGKWGGAFYVDISNVTINSCIIAFNSIC